MYKRVGDQFFFIQTEPMEEERIRMGWNQNVDLPYVKYYYIEPDHCKKLILESDLVLFGGCDEESYIQPRLQQKKPVIRISERIYKEAQWKAISPRGLVRKWIDHTRYRKAPVYLLCAGAYVASDFSIVKAYPNKMFRWGYFPEFHRYDINELMQKKPMQIRANRQYSSKIEQNTKTQRNTADNTADNTVQNKIISSNVVPRILWAARFIDWKHPELVVLTAKHLRDKKLDFHIQMIGGGELQPQIESMIREHDLEKHITLLGYKTPEEVRQHMEASDIYLATSDRGEGWGAVVNESMNSGCAVIANHMMGAVPYLIKHEKNGMIYQDGNKKDLFAITEKLVRDASLCKSLGEQAYATIALEWNAEHAAERLMNMAIALGILPGVQPDVDLTDDNSVGPCSKAPVISEKSMYKRLRNRGM